MKVTKNTRRVFFFNIIMTIISYSRGLECVTKAVYTNPAGKEQIVGSDGQESMKCEADQTVCITVSGSFINKGDAYEIESLRKCSKQSTCVGTLGANQLSLLLLGMDDSLEYEYYSSKAGSTPIARECCEEENCNKPQEITSSGYSIHKISFNNIILLFALSGIFFF